MNIICPFCNLSPDRIVNQSELTLTFRDGFPVSPGHTLIIPRRHVATFFETTAEEQQEIDRAILVAKAQLDEEYSPDGYNIGINNGAAAGQTVFHLHVHLIPRYEGDVAEPKGGVRWIFPGKADYWSKQ